MGFAILYPVHRWLNNNGTPLALGRIYTYIEDSGTAQPAYADSTATTSHGDYVQLDQYGRGAFYLDASLPPYKLVVKDAAGAVVDTLDNVNTNLQGSSFSGITITSSAIVSPTITTPSWAANTIGMPGSVYLGSVALGSNIIADTTILSSTYRNFEIILPDEGGFQSVNDSANIILQLYGGAYATSGYVTLCNGIDTDAAAITANATNGAGFVLCPTTGVGGDDVLIFGGRLLLSLYDTGDNCSLIGNLNVYRGAGGGLRYGNVTTTGRVDVGASNITGFKIMASTGNMTGAGHALVFGIPGI